MDDYDDEMLIEEILCCQSDEDIQSLVDSQCLDIVCQNEKSSLILAHRQLFRMIKLFQRQFMKGNIHRKPQQDTKLFFEQLQLENEKLNEQVKLFEGDKEKIRKLQFLELRGLEAQLNNTIQIISQLKNEQIMSKLCVICMNNTYNMVIKPCGHVCLCESCSINVTKCPIDRMQIKKIKKVFLS